METVAKQDNNIADNSQVIILIENGKKNIDEKYYSDYLNKISDICTVLIHNLDKEKKICVTLDDTLKKLLQYDEYIKKVRNGDIYVSVKNKDTGIKTKEVTYDENIYYYSLQLLVQCLFEKKNV